MSAKDIDEIHSPQFELAKGQLAHELTMLLLSKQVTNKDNADGIYDKYLHMLGQVSSRIDDQTRYEKEHRYWMQATLLGKSEFDVDESRQ